jgi:hypothetical protein
MPTTYQAGERPISINDQNVHVSLYLRNHGNRMSRSRSCVFDCVEEGGGDAKFRPRVRNSQLSGHGLRKHVYSGAYTSQDSRGIIEPGDKI